MSNYTIDQLIQPIASAAQAVLEAKNKVYPNLNTRLVQVSLEQSYNDIIEAYPEFDGVSAVGLKVILNHGDTIYRNGNRLFYLDGTSYAEVEADSLTSAASEGDTEVAIVWYFRNNGYFSLPTTISFSIMEFYVKGGNPSIGNADIPRIYVERTHTLYIDHFSGLSNSNLKETKIVEIDDHFSLKPVNAISFILKSPTINLASQHKYWQFWNGTLSKIIFETENLIMTVVSDNSAFWCTDKRMEIKFIGLKSIVGGNQGTQYRCGFAGGWDVELPATVEQVGQYCFGGGNATGDKYPSIILNCPNATFANNWFAIGYADSLTLANEWNATINLAVATNNPTIYTLDWFTDLIENKLKDLSSETTGKQIAVPSGIYNSLNTADSCPLEYEGKSTGSWVEYASVEKNWTIGTSIV